MHYLVTGGAGFIGSHLCDALLAAGHRVSVLDDLSTGHRHNLAAEVQFVQADCADPQHMPALIARVDGVFHLAAIASVQRSREAWLQTSYTNQMATVALLESIQRDGRKIPFVYASSAAIYGDPDAACLPIVESTPIAPLTPYGADKAGCELHAHVASHVFEIPTQGLRFFNVFGPRQDPSSPYSGVISIFSTRIAAGQEILVFGDGEQTRDFIYVSDVVAHLSASMRRLHAQGVVADDVLNVCRGESISIRELALTLGRICACEPIIRHEPPRTGDIRQSLGNPNAARTALSVKAQVALEDGLRATLAASTH